MGWVINSSTDESVGRKFHMTSNSVRTVPVFIILFGFVAGVALSPTLAFDYKLQLTPQSSFEISSSAANLYKQLNANREPVSVFATEVGTGNAMCGGSIKLQSLVADSQGEAIAPVHVLSCNFGPGSMTYTLTIAARKDVWIKDATSVDDSERAFTGITFFAAGGDLLVRATKSGFEITSLPRRRPVAVWRRW